MNSKVDEQLPVTDNGEVNPRSCQTCAFSHGIQSIGPDGAAIIGQVQLVCMRHPPCCFMRTVKSPVGETHGVVTQFPPVGGDMFCYDYWPEDEPMQGPDALDLITGETITD